MNVGDYVRTKDGVIQKITDVFNTSMEIAMDRGQRIYHYIDIVKSSPQVIDLIEVGDYVNGYYVEDITHNSEEFVLRVVTGSNYFQNPSLYNEDIKTIVTHEQMETMQYRVEE